MHKGVLGLIAAALCAAVAAAQGLESIYQRGFAPAIVLQGQGKGSALKSLDASSAPDVPTLQAAHYDPAALQQCQRHNGADDFNRCLGIIKNRSFDRRALSACGRQQYSDSLNRCLEIIADGRYQGAAVDLCGRHQYADPLNRCLEVIQGKTYTSQELGLCGRHLYADPLNQCLEQTGDPMDSGASAHPPGPPTR